jgi:preprotein translocase subunit SecE
MEKEKTSTTGMLLRELASTAIYKRSQGRIARQVTFAVLLVIIALGCWKLSHFWAAEDPVWLWRYSIPAGLVALGGWVAYRIVCLPRFADFLIAVEAEMSKVSWPTRQELFRSVITVLVVMFAMGAILGLYDVFWIELLQLIGVRK